MLKLIVNAFEPRWLTLSISVCFFHSVLRVYSIHHFSSLFFTSLLSLFLLNKAAQDATKMIAGSARTVAVRLLMGKGRI